MTELPEDRWTDRLHLRRLTEADVEAVAALESAPSPDEAELLARSYVALWSGDGIGYWAMDLRGELVGVAGLRFMTYNLRDCWNLYARVAPGSRRRGLAVEAVTDALTVAFEHVPRLPVVARVRPDNVAGLALAGSAGLERRKDLDRDGYQVLVSHW